MSALPQPAAHADGDDFCALLRRTCPDFAASGLSTDAVQRLNRLALASPLYAQMLLRFPHYCLWLEAPHNLHSDFRYQALLDEWRSFAAAADSDPADVEIHVGLLRRWRRLMSLRIAYRSVNELATEQTTVQELTRL
ncbi:MAG: hypothetical protein KGJ37_00490, partial [Verrucomicrobiota bacterium]|nr:hypothetical protein [Verrucomicrobiota bacterium]